jgi:catechol 2,3-dioxygenase-like lactoylglutathione lyase family enzyme
LRFESARDVVVTQQAHGVGLRDGISRRGLGSRCLGRRRSGGLRILNRDVLGLGREFAAEWGDTPVALMSHGSGLVAQEDLRRRGIAFEFQDHDVAHSIYFQDPDGLLLELTTYDVQRSTT